MAKYGFKLLKVVLRNGRGQANQDFGPSGEPHYLDRVIADVAKMKRDRDSEELVRGDEGGSATVDLDSGEHITIVGDDVITTDTESLPEGVQGRPESVVRIEEAIAYKSGLLLKIMYGIVGDHSLAADPTGERADVDLRGLATTRAYRAMIIAPPSGENGFLAVEVISRSHAAADLPRRLFNAADGHNRKLKTLGPVADAAAVRELVREGRVTSVELIKSIVPSDAASAGHQNVKMVFPIAAGMSAADSILSRVRGWIPSRSSADDATLDPATEARAIASILWSDAAELAFDDARVDVKSLSNGRKLQPLDKKDGFTYELGDSELDDNSFVREVASAAQGLFDANDMEMEDDWAQPLSS
jgi:hypothetical protein